jgi:hypothetical protein
VRVHYDEGVAIRIGPEPCAGVREGTGEASVGECTGQPLSRERLLIPGADAVEWAEGNTYGRDSASVRMARRGRRPGMCRRSLSLGTGRARVRPLGLRPPVRVGKARSRSRRCTSARSQTPQ